MRLCVVIPAYNAARHIDGVLERVGGLVSSGLSHVVVVDDASTDDTAARVERHGARAFSLELLRRPKNGGYGAAMKQGLAAAAERSPDVVACIHADGQYAPEALPGLMGELSSRRLDLLQGSRIASGRALQGGMPLYKYVGNALLNRLENRTLELSLTDYHSGYLVYGPRALTLPLHRLSDSFDFDLEVIASARARGLAVGEAAVPTHYGDEISHLNPLTYGLRVLRVLWNYRRGHYDAA
ncbi:MAG TPA: glycosyltransferase family 2 protein [Polyangiaceae bacterium]|nr:glycosyltransferase family 2 protein [Polyangiaceae bacterium]